MASVKLTNVKKVYDKKVVAVHDFNLDIKDKAVSYTHLTLPTNSRV